MIMLHEIPDRTFPCSCGFDDVSFPHECKPYANTTCPHCKISQSHYQRLLEFVILVSKERHETDPFFKFVTESARDVLKEIGGL